MLASREEQSPMLRRGSSSEDTISFYGTIERQEEPESDSNTNTSNHQEAETDNDDDDEVDPITHLTRRLRCLFGIITWPIVPLATLVSIALLWMLAGALQDSHQTCSHPLHWYAVASAALVVYAPLHTYVRARLFSYVRERDGPHRPVPVRQFDQCFHTLTLIYVYVGIMLVQTCRSDILINDNNDNNNSSMNQQQNTCAATCPHLFPALRLYVTMIELFTLSLILPLLCLPCLYLWFLRRATADAETLSLLQDRLREEEALLRNGTAHEILQQQLQEVKLVVDPRTIDRRILIVPSDNCQDFALGKDANGVKECCICMETFVLHGANDIETGQLNDNNNNDDEGSTTTTPDNEVIVRTTTCGHLFHKRCIASWVGGRWEPSASSSGSNNNEETSRRARRTTCPLCRTDLRPDSSS